MRAQRRHACTAADIDHFLVARFDVEIAERPDGADLVAGSEPVDIRRAHTRSAILPAWWRRDADIESQLTVHGWVGGDRVVTAHRSGIFCATLEYVLSSPHGREGLSHRNIGE